MCGNCCRAGVYPHRARGSALAPNREKKRGGKNPRWRQDVVRGSRQPPAGALAGPPPRGPADDIKRKRKSIARRLNEEEAERQDRQK